MWIHGFTSRGPASSSSTECSPDAVSRLASTQPAEPAPTMTKSKQPKSFMPDLRSCAGDDGADTLGKGQRRGQARRFDPEQIDYAVHAMGGRSVDAEICGKFGWAGDFRPDARVARRKLVIAQLRPIRADRDVEFIRAARIDSVVERLNPLHVGPEPRLAAQIERQVHAETAGLWYRVDQARERCSAGEREIVSLGIPGARNMCLWETFHAARHLRCMQ